MRVLSPILRRVVYPSLGGIGYFRDHAPAFLSVITYHGVLPEGYQSRDPFLDSILVSREMFRRQLRLLKSDYDVITWDQFMDWLGGRTGLPARAVLLTCDDGLLNNVTDMLPILQEERLSCIFFVTGASASEAASMLWHVELYLMLANSRRQSVKFSSQGVAVEQQITDSRARQSLWHDLLYRLSPLTAQARCAFLAEAGSQLGLQADWKSVYVQDPVLRRRFALLRNSDLLRFLASGMSIGAHSLSHSVLSELDSELAEAEIVESRTALETAGRRVVALAYPFGNSASVGEREFRFAAKAGFQCAFMNEGGTVAPNSPRLALPRVHISGTLGLREFEAHVTGFHDHLRGSWPRPRRRSSAYAFGGGTCA